MRLAARIAACTLLASATLPVLAARVEVDGAVQRPGAYDVADGARFADAVLAAMPTAAAYPLGAAALQPAAMVEQRRQKAGLLYDLDALAADPSLAPTLTQRVHAMRDWLATLPVTGRVHADLDPRRLELDAPSNHRLADGDRFTYPVRPDTVRVVGAVVAPCELAHVPLRDAADYLCDCPIDAGAADRDLLYVIQPDGEVQRLGIAAWNRSAPQALAPGAVLYVPLDERALHKWAPDLNAEVANFLATQPLPAATP